jgi:beta-glucosidase
MNLKHKDIISKMSLEDKAQMMSGKSVWETYEYEKYGIPGIFLSDGPHGLRRQAGAGDHLGLNGSLPATCFPSAAGMANTWDEQLGQEVGQALAEEAVTMDVNVVLGPGLNIKRSPLCGRNFEYFTEDPYLAGKMAASYVRGIQSKGISACPKHFAANSQELRRMAMDSVIDERTLREIYLTGFEIVVRESAPKSIMSSYNEVNGVYANENHHLLQEILRDTWGFDGFVVSDWGASNEHALGVKNGSHLEMPGVGKEGMYEILRGIKDGTLTEEELDQRLDEFLDVILAIKPATIAAKGTSYDVEAHHKLARKAAEEAIVLLKNQDHILPLDGTKSLAIMGDFAKTPRYQGAGSSLVNPAVAPESILKCLGFDQKEEKGDYDLQAISFHQGYIRNHKPVQSLIDEAAEAAKKVDVVVIFAGLDEISESEGLDRTHMHMPEAQNQLIAAVAKVNPNVVVCLSAGSSVEMPWFDDVAAVVHGYLGGQASASAMLDVISGKVCPSGHLNETYPLAYEDTPAYAYYPSKERSSEYREGLFVGYRYYDTVDAAVRFPFGYGLSYTTFTYSDLKVTEKGIGFTVKNTGDCTGTAVPQMYIGRKEVSDYVYRPKKELKGFTRVTLEPGEEKQVNIPFDEYTFRFFDAKADKFIIESGEYVISLGENVRDIVLTGSFTCEPGELFGLEVKEVSDVTYSRQEIPSYYTGNITNVSQGEYEKLYVKELPPANWGGEFQMNDAVAQLNRGKSVIGWIYWGVLKLILKIADIKGKPSLNALFQYNMPIRGYAKMTGGAVSMEMCRAITEICNGHRIKGLGHLIKAAAKRDDGIA